MTTLVLTQAWMLSSTIKDGHSISVVATEVAKVAGMDWESVRDIILDGLRATSDEHYEGPGTGMGEIGHCVIGDQEVWWLHNNAVTEWYADCPDWWEEQVEQWAGHIE